MADMKNPLQHAATVAVHELCRTGFRAERRHTAGIPFKPPDKRN